MTFSTWLSRSQRFFDEYTKGVDPLEIHKVLGRDATRAFDVLTRDQPDRSEDRGTFARFWDRTRRLFLGLSKKLTPSRRILFAVCILLALLGIWDHDFVIGADEIRILSSPLWLLASIAGFILLIVLELADRVVIRNELEVARQLQRELIAERAPDVPGYGFAFSYRTANTIGGDYYEFVPLTDGRLLIATGDASGHGIAAGLLMAVANSALKLAVDLDKDPAAVAATVNGALYRTGGPRAFMTLFCAVLDPESGRLDYVCAGHPFPLLRRASGTIEELGTGAIPTGIRKECHLEVATTLINRGDILVMYSDGIPEMLNSNGAAFGFDRLQQIVAQKGGSARSLHDTILSDVDNFADGEAAHDDQSLVVVERH